MFLRKNEERTFSLQSSLFSSDLRCSSSRPLARSSRMSVSSSTCVTTISFTYNIFGVIAFLYHYYLLHDHISANLRNKHQTMRLTVILSSLLLASSSAFVVSNNNVSPAVALRMAEEEAATATETEVPIVLNGKNIELTEAITAYVQKRIGGPLKKMASGGLIRECDVHLSVNKNPKVKNGHRVDLTASLKGLTIHCKEESPDMYESLDAASHALNRKLMKYKERRMQGYHAGNSMGDDLMAVLEALEEDLENTPAAEEEFVDPEAPKVTKVNSYDLKNSISLEEAIFALDYVDHDFFVFRNSESDSVNVVYKRNAGGVGLIEV